MRYDMALTDTNVIMFVLYIFRTYKGAWCAVSLNGAGQLTSIKP